MPSASRCRPCRTSSVPNFLRDLALRDWVPVKVHAYETGGGTEMRRESSEEKRRGRGLGRHRVYQYRYPGLVVAAHGPVTASGAERLGIRVDVVSSRFHSFDGVVDALALRWSASE
ncbi:hypothetical protein CK203_069465 [Vitis vinifera]|uniref:Uroporphyrinogen-III synthase n=1 Tax=Vitis vinifera TaxID=29760 RepID=A0A438BZT0_VITVI|nr:hypothetical protein CK203_069465 [Vitis vinifera]